MRRRILERLRQLVCANANERRPAMETVAGVALETMAGIIAVVTVLAE
jgi:hypothetical protein